MQGALLSSVRMDWNTPDSVLCPMREFSQAAYGNAQIALDPCSNGQSIVDASSSFDAASDGLAHSWRCNGLVYLNPPYGRAIKAWMQKAAQEAAGGVQIASLVPARVDTKWFQEAAKSAQCILFMRGRVRFVGAPSSAPFPTAIIYWGQHPEAFQSCFSPMGLIWRPNP
jgi:hypothetical protein